MNMLTLHGSSANGAGLKAMVFLVFFLFGSGPATHSFSEELVASSITDEFVADLDDDGFFANLGFGHWAILYLSALHCLASDLPVIELLVLSLALLDWCGLAWDTWTLQVFVFCGPATYRVHSEHQNGKETHSNE